MFPDNCNVAIAAACGHVGPDALGTVSMDPHEKQNYDDLCDTKIVDVRPSIAHQALLLRCSCVTRHWPRGARRVPH